MPRIAERSLFSRQMSSDSEHGNVILRAIPLISCIADIWIAASIRRQNEAAPAQLPRMLDSTAAVSAGAANRKSDGLLDSMKFSLFRGASAGVFRILVSRHQLPRQALIKQ